MTEWQDESFEELTDELLADARQRVERAAQYFLSKLLPKLPSKTGTMKAGAEYSMSENGLIATVFVPHPMQFIEFGWLHAGSGKYIAPRPIFRQTLIEEEAALEAILFGE